MTDSMWSLFGLIVGVVLMLSIFAADDPGSWFLGTCVGALGALFLAVVYGIHLDEQEEKDKGRTGIGVNGSKHSEQTFPHKGENFDSHL